MNFTTATKHDARLRLALSGPAGSGKTYTALRIATSLGKRVALIDSEHGSASKYADEFRFDTVRLESYSPTLYIAAIEAAEQSGYDVLVIDSLSHAWSGKDGALEMADREKVRSKTQNGFTAWLKVTPVWQSLIEKMLSSRLHLIATLRSKTEYVIETTEKGKAVPRKVGLSPIIRDNTEYEFDIVGDMTPDHQMIVVKTRCRKIDGEVIEKPGPGFAATRHRWLQGEGPEERSGVGEKQKPKPKASSKSRPSRATSGGKKGGENVSRLPAGNSITLEIEKLGNEIYHDMWCEQSEKIALWASDHRTKGIAELTQEEKGRVLEGLREKMKKAA